MLHQLITPSILQLCARTHLVVRADVQQHRETVLWQNATAGCVERQLSHRNAHTVASQVAQAEDALPVRHHNGLHREHILAICISSCVYVCVGRGGAPLCLLQARS